MRSSSWFIGFRTPVIYRSLGGTNGDKKKWVAGAHFIQQPMPFQAIADALR